MVAVATGQTASLACLVNENTSNQRLYWLDSNGELIVNNSGSNSYIDQDGSSQGGQRYTINTGPVFVTSYNHEKDKDGTTFLRKKVNISKVDRLVSSSSSILISSALSYENGQRSKVSNGERHTDRMVRDYAVNEENRYRSDENLDTRDPFVVGLRILHFYLSL